MSEDPAEGVGTTQRGCPSSNEHAFNGPPLQDFTALLDFCDHGRGVAFVVDGMLFHMPGDWQIDMVVTQGEIEDAVSFDVSCCE